MYSTPIYYTIHIGYVLVLYIWLSNLLLNVIYFNWLRESFVRLPIQFIEWNDEKKQTHNEIVVVKKNTARDAHHRFSWNIQMTKM